MDRFNGAEAAVRMLQLNGVRHIFGLCGDTSLPLILAGLGGQLNGVWAGNGVVRP